jgi:hypothetical protein
MLYAEFLRLIIKHKIGNRPDRIEPRAVKLRKKRFPMLNRPRAIERIRIQKKIDKIISKNAFA